MHPLCCPKLQVTLPWLLESGISGVGCSVVGSLCSAGHTKKCSSSSSARIPTASSSGARGEATGTACTQRALTQAVMLRVDGKTKVREIKTHLAQHSPRSLLRPLWM